ncbi:MAG: NUDIX hydrolase [Cytophagaceae bacterium]|nr:NUDIX hydrolase [Cytophagaceae bacterium]MDW8456288.1 NUDIX hydrolase [Cytophagaceae bacterium]
MNTTENPWSTLSIREIYENPWIRITEADIINPKGGKGIYGVVHFKNKAIGVVPVDENGYTYLVGQYRYTLNEYSWEIPEGGGPMHEDPIHTAARELKEETGLTAQKYELICRIHTSNSVTDEEGFIFLATGLSRGESQPEETEELQIKKILLAEAVQMVMNNEITDSLSIAGLLKAARILKI